MSEQLTYMVRDEFRPRRWPDLGTREINRESYEGLYIESDEYPSPLKEKRQKPGILTHPPFERVEVRVISKARYWFTISKGQVPFAVVKEIGTCNELADLYLKEPEYRVHIKIPKRAIQGTVLLLEDYMHSKTQHSTSGSHITATYNPHTTPLHLVLNQFRSDKYWEEQFGKETVWHAEIAVRLPRM